MHSAKESFTLISSEKDSLADNSSVKRLKRKTESLDYLIVHNNLARNITFYFENELRIISIGVNFFSKLNLDKLLTFFEESFKEKIKSEDISIMPVSLSKRNKKKESVLLQLDKYAHGLIKNTYDRKILEDWKSNEINSVYFPEIDNQIKKIENIDF